jgi:hypothetical protein
MERLSVKGVLIGAIVDVVTSVMMGIPFAVYATLRLDLAHIPKDQIGPATTAAIHGSTGLYLAELLVGCACSVLGGYVAAWLAKHDELLNGALSSFLCVALGIFTISSGKDWNALWVQLLMLVASPLLGLLGGFLRLTQKRARSVQPA